MFIALSIYRNTYQEFNIVNLLLGEKVIISCHCVIIVVYLFRTGFEAEAEDRSRTWKGIPNRQPKTDLCR